MLPTSIVNSCSKLVQTYCLPAARRKWRDQVSFAIAALALRPLVSLNANARTTGNHKGTAESKMARLLSNKGLSPLLCNLIASLTTISEHSFVAVDYSDFSGLTALVCAMQTRMGRALPIFMAATYSGRLPAVDDAPKRTQLLRAAYQALNQKLTDHTVESLKVWRKQLGFWPKLVFDRGFGNEKIIRYLHKQGVTFYVRMKAGRLTELAGDKISLLDLPTNDEVITLYGIKLRIVVSQKVGRHKEPWYILTSDLASSAKRIIKIYYHRFEIEETFRDIKSILGMRRTKLLKPLSLEILLWFVSLGIVLLYLAGIKTLGKRKLKQLVGAVHIKKRLSWYRSLLEMFERELRQPIYALITGAVE